MNLFGDLFPSSPPPLPVYTSLEELASALNDCARCRLHESRTRIVFGDGDPHAKLVIVGEAPGVHEDEQGIPFVGRAGQLLNKILEAIEIKREEVYICNLVKCRPPENRTPLTDEIETCNPFLTAQLNLINPKIICAMGTPATQTLLRTKKGITELRGRFHDLNGIPVMPTYHPAYLLRNPAKKRECWEDMKLVRDRYREILR
ncbi:MAG: uracil-DNA glycosylase [Candidatus Latescibacteria bacterium]|nr:uracil-DNA glycosylase [Candidatus Latescibacterota bacterium]